MNYTQDPTIVEPCVITVIGGAMTDRKQQLETLADEYRRLCYMALEANECGNMGGMDTAQHEMHKVNMRRRQIDIDILY